MRLVSIAMTLALAAACGSKQNPSGNGTGTGTGDDTGTPPAAGADAGTPTGGDDTGGGGTAGDGSAGKRKAWADLTKDEKKEIMKKQVVPAMRELWKSSPEPDAEIECTFCHGDQAMDGKFDMPNKDLPMLDFKTGMADIKKKKDGQAWIEFMGGKVKPKMAEILGLPEYSKDNPTGFGCGNCHGNIKM
jgi:hypothetical protein